MRSKIMSIKLLTLSIDRKSVVMVVSFSIPSTMSSRICYKNKVSLDTQMSKKSFGKEIGKGNFFQHRIYYYQSQRK